MTEQQKLRTRRSFLKVIVIVILVVFLGGRRYALAQETAPRGPIVQYPSNPVRFGISTQDFNNGRIRAAIVTGTNARMPAGRVRRVYTRENGEVVFGPTVRMIRGDIITWVTEEKTGQRWRIRGSRDLREAVQSLPPGARFYVTGYDAGNRYRSFTAVVQLD
ncbi:MAG: hypothetical protein ACYC61_01725 [Isosphaeraceae bacterium]